MSISELIAGASERLTPTERRISGAVLAEPTLLAFGTVSDLADKIGTSRPSIVRFAHKLGFDGYADLQSHVRVGLSADLSRPSERIRNQGESLAPTRTALEESLASVFEALTEDRLQKFAAPLLKAQNIWIITGETSRAGAHALHSGLSMVRPNVQLIDEHSSARVLCSAGPGDAAVVMDFARYRRHTIGAAKSLSAVGVEIVALTDGPLSPLAPIARTWCAVTIPAIGPFDSSVPVVAAAELIVAYVAAQIQTDAKARIDRTEALWDASGTFVD
jgi:DNA-binding MurR/RpiR family transcriptional regulator